MPTKPCLPKNKQSNLAFPSPVSLPLFSDFKEHVTKCPEKTEAVFSILLHRRHHHQCLFSSAFTVVAKIKSQSERGVLMPSWYGGAQAKSLIKPRLPYPFPLCCPWWSFPRRHCCLGAGIENTCTTGQWSWRSSHFKPIALIFCNFATGSCIYMCWW